MGRAGLVFVMVAVGSSCTSEQRFFGNADPTNAAGEEGGGTRNSDGVGGKDLGSVSHGGSHAGQAETAEGGAGASGETKSSLRVVMMSPADSDVDVERDEVIEVTFSERIDPNSVTAESFVVSGPDGVVDGQLSTQGEKIVFTAVAPYNLLAAVTVDLSTQIRDLDGVSLADAVRLGFRVRDGELGTPQRISTDDTTNLTIVGALSGQIGLSWSADATSAGAAKSRPWTVLFDPKAASWGTPTAHSPRPTC